MLLGEIIQEARTLTNAERCSVFLVDKASNELVSKVFDVIVTIDEVSLDPIYFLKSPYSFWLHASKLKQTLFFKPCMVSLTLEIPKVKFSSTPIYTACF